MIYHKISKHLLSFISLIFIFSCSSPVPKNKWQYDTVSMSQAYEKHFLQGKMTRSNLDLKHAKHLAKQSSNLKILIDVELTQCALQLAVLNPQSCTNIDTLLEIQPNAKQTAYLNLIRSKISAKEINLLPNQYYDFTQALIEKDVQAINKTLENIQPLSSKLIASALAIRYINDENISTLIQELSFSGYKQALLPWLSVQASKEEDRVKRDHIKEKIKILLSKEV